MALDLPDRSEILRAFAAETRGLHVAEVSARLKIPVKGRKRLRVALDQLVRQGELAALPGQRYRRTGQLSAETWVGALSVHQRGFGFVNAEGQPDVYLPPDALGPALHGDTVRVRLVSKSDRGLEGQVESVIERGSDRVVGTLRRRARSLWLEPNDLRLRGPIVITDRPSDAADGLAAVVRITRFPASADENPEGEVLSVLGAPDEARVQVAMILADHKIEEEHSPEALAEAKRRVEALEVPELGRRSELRPVPLLTIDPEDARDHDDAVWVERRPRGYRAYVAIADVAEFVQAGGALDADASQRCFTTYLPDRAVPMLPSVLAADQCSLLPGVDRYALCAIVDLDNAGEPQRLRLEEALVRVRAKLSYRQAACVLGFIDEPPDAEALLYEPDLRVLHELASKLRKNRMGRGALDLDLPEPKVVLDSESGEPVGVTRRTQEPGLSSAYQLVEEMMLLANERVARWLLGKRSPAVFRVHAAPDEEKLEQLARVAERLGVAVDIEALAEPLGLSQWLAAIASHPLRSVLSNLALRSLKMAQYDTHNVGHFGLALEHYVHFTSPIRRYPDLLVHRLCKELVRRQPPRTSDEERQALSESANRASQVEREVLQAEREVVDVYRCLLMRERVGESFAGQVAAFTGSGVFVTLDEPFVEVLVRHESLGPEHYELSEDGLAVVAGRSGERIQLGDSMMVLVEEVSLWRRSILGRRLARAGDVVEPSDYHRGRETGERAPRPRPGAQRTPLRRGGSRGAAPGRLRGPTRKPGGKPGGPRGGWR